LDKQKKEQLTRKDKQMQELRKDNENLTRLLDHEQIHSDNQRRIIEWLCDQSGSFYKSDVEEDE
jgi:F0F1-type ATP synthase delta subunit